MNTRNIDLLLSAAVQGQVGSFIELYRLIKSGKLSGDELRTSCSKITANPDSCDDKAKLIIDYLYGTIYPEFRRYYAYAGYGTIYPQYPGYDYWYAGDVLKVLVKDNLSTLEEKAVLFDLFILQGEIKSDQLRQYNQFRAPAADSAAQHLLAAYIAIRLLNDDYQVLREGELKQSQRLGALARFEENTQHLLKSSIGVLTQRAQMQAYAGRKQAIEALLKVLRERERGVEKPLQFESETVYAEELFLQGNEVQAAKLNALAKTELALLKMLEMIIPRMMLDYRRGVPDVLQDMLAILKSKSGRFAKLNCIVELAQKASTPQSALWGGARYDKKVNPLLNAIVEFDHNKMNDIHHSYFYRPSVDEAELQRLFSEIRQAKPLQLSSDILRLESRSTEAVMNFIATDALFNEEEKIALFKQLLVTNKVEIWYLVVFLQRYDHPAMNYLYDVFRKEEILFDADNSSCDAKLATYEGSPARKLDELNRLGEAYKEALKLESWLLLYKLYISAPAAIVSAEEDNDFVLVPDERQEDQLHVKRDLIDGVLTWTYDWTYKTFPANSADPVESLLHHCTTKLAFFQKIIDEEIIPRIKEMLAIINDIADYQNVLRKRKAAKLLRDMQSIINNGDVYCVEGSLHRLRLFADREFRAVTYLSSQSVYDNETRKMLLGIENIDVSAVQEFADVIKADALAASSQLQIGPQNDDGPGL